MDKECLWKHNSSSQNEFLIREYFRTKNINGLQEMLEKGFPLSPFILSLMVANSYSDEVIRSFIDKASVVTSEAKEWIADYFDVDTLAVLLKKRPELAPSHRPSNEDCVKYQLWEVLRIRREWKLLAKYVPKLIEGEPAARAALLAVNIKRYAPEFFEQKEYGLFFEVEDGWKYLVENGKAGIVLNEESYFRFGLLDKDEVAEYCWQKGYIQLLYEKKFYNVLLAHQEFDIFIKKRSFNAEFLTSAPNRADWEDLWHHAATKGSRKYLLEQAMKNKNVLECRAFLMNHLGWFGQIKLLLSEKF